MEGEECARANTTTEDEKIDIFYYEVAKFIKKKQNINNSQNNYKELLL